ncbi:hypothetical protein [Paenibacillus thalictri]|uniref:Uncharacterized protein n=1 Tax=Paenibacillus thalictri TaxID=2527873 RepID=A0A4Q9DUF1_9BACL|nr:hypothetical protein [Paenibacillus thalictri]TBL80624.1 hypothetical protein EYB31_05185 [Paenibacillus thalictri]
MKTSDPSQEQLKKTWRFTFKIVVFFICSFLLILLSVEGYGPEQFYSYMKDKSLSLLGIAIALWTTYYWLPPLFQWGQPSQTFIDLDRANIIKPQDTGVSGGYTGIPSEQEPAEIPPSALSFQLYFMEMKQLFEQKASLANQKASVLLDKGTKYAQFGIVFYVCTIALWQVLALALGEFKTQMVYGIASCSFLFLFIEFLSAWFLKQYQHFVDTSTYLIKVKSIFDKYMLVVLFYQESEDIPGREIVLRHLTEDIKWPDMSKLHSDEVSFAKEAVDTAIQLIQSLQKLPFYGAEKAKAAAGRDQEKKSGDGG